MTRQIWSSVKRVSRLPTWTVAVAVAFGLGAVVGPMAASAGPVAVSAGGVSNSSRGGSSLGVPPLKHVFVIMMENTSYDDLLSSSNPNTTFIQQLAANNGLATNYFGVTHVSLPNYIATTSGSNWGSNSDDTAQAPLFNHQNLVDQFEAARVSWKAYMEDLPSPGDLVDSTPDGLYVRKHNPFLMYPDVYNNPSRADNVVPLTQLSTDLAANRVPQFVWITPNICNDMHGGASSCPFPSSPTDPLQAALYQDGDNFLRTWVTAITHSKAWTGRSAIFITWDEGSFADDPPFGPNDIRPGPDSPILPATPADPTTGGGGDLAGGTVYGGGHVPMIVVARGVGHRIDSTFAGHYSLLQTVEQNFGLPLLGNAGDLVQVGNLSSLLK